MAPAQPNADEAPVTPDELISLLRQANSLLGHLRMRAEKVVALYDPVALGFCPGQVRTLRGIIDHGRGRIQRRLAILAGPDAEGDDPAEESNPPADIAEPIAFMAEYRACCRLLCRALNESLRVANAAAGAMLSDFVLRLEKQLWLMDTPKQNPGSDRYRSVSLFLTC
jgi:hypothetical protein